MGIADAILDLVSSGTTLKENNLKEIKGGTVLESQVGNCQILWPLTSMICFFNAPGNCCFLCLVRLDFTLTIEHFSGCSCCKQEIIDQSNRSTWNNSWDAWKIGGTSEGHGAVHGAYIEFTTPHLPKLQFLLLFLFIFLMLDLAGYCKHERK